MCPASAEAVRIVRSSSTLCEASPSSSGPIPARRSSPLELSLITQMKGWNAAAKS